MQLRKEHAGFLEIIQSYPITVLDRLLGLQELKFPRISRQ
jgi:hypothetical protein